jgi:hypothetical protein
MPHELWYDEALVFGPSGQQGPQVDSQGRPISILGAIGLLPDEDWEELVQVWGFEPGQVPPAEIAGRIARTVHKVDSETSSVLMIWADPQGNMMLQVFKSEPATPGKKGGQR